jgi:asparagine synthase (glutamine-hydrolysing)
MCGIAGFTYPVGDRASCLATALAMGRAIAHRGPESLAAQSVGGATFAAAELAFVAPEAPHQPLVSEDRQRVVVLNGELYDCHEQRARLMRAGHRFRTSTDTELILRLYDRYDLDFLEHVHGMYALALYDNRLRRLILARDPMGKKPLYWAQGKDGVVFASEPRALFQHPHVPREADPEALATFLVLNTIPSPRTAYRGITKLRPASALRHQDGVLEEWTTWHPPTDTLPISATSAKSKVRVELEEAVRRRMAQTTVELGILASGGLDSSLVAALAARHATRPLKLFCAGFDDPSYDESPHAAALAKSLGAELHVLRLGAAELATAAHDILPAIDEPLADPSLLPTLLLARFAREHVKGVLSGDGGDELFWGYPFFLAARLVEALPRTVVKGTVAFLSRLVGRLPIGHSNMHPSLILGLLLRGSLAPAETRFFVTTGGFSPAELEGVLSQDTLGALSGEDPYGEIHRFLGESPKDALERCRRSMLRVYLGDTILTKMDRASALASLEVRSPFLDRHVVDLALRLPRPHSLGGTQTKVLLRELGKDLLPTPLALRKKQGFRAPIARLLTRELRPLAEELLSERALQATGLLATRGVRALWGDHLSQRRDHHKALWPIVCLQLWHEHWIRGPLSSQAVELPPQAARGVS